MCGIVGFTGNYDRSLLRRMNRKLTHRGPDEEGYLSRPGVGLAMRRLCIIDVEGGHQPISNADKTIWTVFNGEIYNFRELRRDLQKKGYRFKTDHSDTETIVHAYEEYGPKFVEHLNGMFAIAVWDEKKKKLLLYRDRVGEKPLYYWKKGKHLFFASEIKSLLAIPFFKRELNEEALFYYLGLKHTPRHQNFFKGIHSLSPGEMLTVQKGIVKKKLYWEIDASKTLRIDEKEAAAEIRRLLKSSTKYRMVSDVPLGAYLSGGVDSSAVVGYMSKLRDKRVDTFSLTYRDALSNKQQDEISAAEMSKKFNTRHRKYRMGSDEFDQDLNKIVDSFDEPFGGTISTFFLSKLIRKHVTVAVSGDGADEMFGSYLVHRLAYPMQALNSFIKKGKDPYSLSATDQKALGPFADQIDFLMRIRGPQPHSWHSKLLVYSDEEKQALFTSRFAKKMRGKRTADYYRKIYARSKSSDVLNQVLQVECQNLLPDQVLAFVDRLSMAHSVEVRPPFLDHRMVEFAFKLPGKMKIKDGVNKYILKKAVSTILPHHILHRPKEGFILPYHYWLQNHMADRVQRTLSPKALKKHGYFDTEYVKNLVREYRDGSLVNSNKVYLLLMFQIWWNRYFG